MEKEISREEAEAASLELKCKNCGTPLNQEDDYCGHCGAKVIRNRLTIRTLFHHINETYFNYDNKLLRTFLTLFSDPKDVIVGYISGVRRKYVDVISYFAIAITLSGLQIFVTRKVGMDMDFYDTSTAVGRQQQAMFNRIYSFSTDYQSLVLMTYVPIYALIAKLIFRRYKKFNYTELLVFFLYTQAHLSIIFAVATPLLILPGIISLVTLGTIIIPLQLLYFIYALKEVFGLTGKQIFWRTVMFLLLILLLLVIFSVGFAAFMIKTGILENNT